MAVAHSGGSRALAPLREPTFRRIWTASLFSNFGQLILGVGAAWEMTRLSNSPSMVALVQSALMLPLMLVAVPAGAIADMFDRRRIALTGLGFAALSGALLTALAFAGLTTPWMLLGFCVLIGGGVALYSPSWQASIGEQVSEEHLPAAIALGSISYNIARSFGPALGGLIVVAFGAKAAFGINAVFYLPLWVAFFFWQRRHTPSRLPPERIDRAIVSGARYALHSPPIRTVLTRAFLFGLSSSAYIALGPLVARNLLHGTAATYGIMLGATGVGAVLGALFVGDLRERFSAEAAIRGFAAVTGGALVIIALSRWLPLTCVGFFLVGLCNMTTASLLNVSVQLSSPRWVTARALSLYTSATTGGVAFGASGWGVVTSHAGVSFSLLCSATAVLCTVFVGFVLPLQDDREVDIESIGIDSEIPVALGLTMRSGPVVIEIEYDVDPDHARGFYDAVLKLQRVRNRNGGFDWSISRDIADPALWLERYHCPTWGDYLRMRDRYTQAELDLQRQADGFNRSGQARRARRLLERPFGSVRWKAESPDLRLPTVGYLGP
ncbi:MAG: MFS transporter [Novosphingobium sp.]|nr:MFS transporter [Novosphingobium sp.]